MRFGISVANSTGLNRTPNASPSVKPSFSGLGRRLGFFEFFDVLGGIFVKVFAAILAAKLDFAPLVGIKHRGAHVAAQLFTRHDTGRQRIGSQLARQLLVIRVANQG